MEIDAATAAALGFPKLKYVFVERERRWLCDRLPKERVLRSEAVTDLYITGTRLRLREARPLDGGEPKRRLGRKADVDASTRLITSIYLTEVEFALLANLPGRTLQKVRHHLKPVDGIDIAVDVFDGALTGLVMAEAEFADDAAMHAFPHPDFAIREVTGDARYGGGSLSMHGLPAD
jgi:CYTH domain-containing protein